MAWLIGDSFDFYNVVADMILPGTIWTTATSGTIQTATRFSTGVALQIGGTGAYATQTFTNSTTIYVNFAASDVNHAITLGGTTVGAGFSLRDGGTNQVGIFFRNGGDVVVTNGALGGTVLATYPAQLWTALNTYRHLQFKIVINNITGSVEMRIDGNTSDDWNVTGINTRNGTVNNQVNSIAFSGAGGSTSYSVDDFYVFNDQGAAPNTWQGDIRAVQQMPTSDSSVTWTHSTGSTNFGVVDEPRQNGDTDYVSTSTINNVDAYGVSALATTPVSILAVQTKMIARMDDVGPHTVKSRLTSSSTNADSSNLSLSSSYQWLSQLNLVDPNTSAAWTAANLAAVKIGPFDVL